MHSGAPATASAISALQRVSQLSRPFLVDVLGTLVRTKSVNPGTSERAIADVILGWFEGTRVETTVVEFAPGRPSVAAVLRGTGDGPTLVLNGHMDTVPIDDESLWTVEPFAAEVRDGFLYGRGACDMKAGLAVQIGVAHYLNSLAPAALRGTLILHFASGEERGEPGTRSLLDAGFIGDFGITTEPTKLRVASATRGTAYYCIKITGRSIHASQAHLGHNPIWPLRQVLDILEDYDNEVRLLQHPLLPGGSCTPTLIHAGVKENSVPDDCEITVDRRLLPGESVAKDNRALMERLESLKSIHPSFQFSITPGFLVEPAEIDPKSAFVERMLQAAFDVTGERTEVWGAPFGSDVRNLVNDAGMEAVTFGPGDVAECHCPDERVSIQEIELAAVTIGKVATDLLLSEGTGHA